MAATIHTLLRPVSKVHVSPLWFPIYRKRPPSDRRFWSIVARRVRQKGIRSMDLTAVLRICNEVEASWESEASITRIYPKTDPKTGEWK
jgi:hypothetical protein